MSNDQLDARLREVESRVEIAGILVARILDRLAEIEEILVRIQFEQRSERNVSETRARLLDAARSREW
jgi:hypothetical protein